MCACDPSLSTKPSPESLCDEPHVNQRFQSRHYLQKGQVFFRVIEILATEISFKSEHSHFREYDSKAIYVSFVTSWKLTALLQPLASQ